MGTTESNPTQNQPDTLPPLVLNPSNSTPAQKQQQQNNKQQSLFHVENMVFPLSTSSKNIVDFQGKIIKIAGVSWSGGHTCRQCVDGLECRRLKDIAYDIRFRFKMNCVRLTYSIQMFYDQKIIPGKYLTANPELIGKTPIQIFDITVKTLTDMGLMVILNNHTSTSQWCCSNDDGDGLWWSWRYPEYIYFQHVDDISKRYHENKRVIGIDLRNQIRKAHNNEPTWGDGVARTDWKRAAEKAAQIALKNTPNWLIFIGGLNYQLDLSGVRQKPITLSIPNKLVYTGHFFGFSWMFPTWTGYTYQSFRKKLYSSQIFVRNLDHPFLLGQFGTSAQDIPWKYIIRYIKEAQLDWLYWPLDGFKSQPDKDQPFGIYSKNFLDVRHPEIVEDLMGIGAPAAAMETLKYYLPKEYQELKQEGQAVGGEEQVEEPSLGGNKNQQKQEKIEQKIPQQQTQKKIQPTIQQKQTSITPPPLTIHSTNSQLQSKNPDNQKPTPPPTTLQNISSTSNNKLKNPTNPK